MRSSLFISSYLFDISTNFGSITWTAFAKLSKSDLEFMFIPLLRVDVIFSFCLFFSLSSIQSSSSSNHAPSKSLSSLFRFTPKRLKYFLRVHVLSILATTCSPALFASFSRGIYTLSASSWRLKVNLWDSTNFCTSHRSIPIVGNSGAAIFIATLNDFKSWALCIWNHHCSVSCISSLIASWVFSWI